MLFLNATDLDRSREYGQESIIYSLEGSVQFRINARSGEPQVYALPPSDQTDGGLLLFRVFEHAVSSLKYSFLPYNHPVNVATGGCLRLMSPVRSTCVPSYRLRSPCLLIPKCPSTSWGPGSSLYTPVGCGVDEMK